MKKIFYSLLVSLAAVACTQELKPDYNKDWNGETVKVDFSVNVPGDELGTKALSVAPDIRNLYVAVFDESGYLYEYKAATFTKVTDNGESNAQNFSVDLKVVKGKKRTVHFIANGPASVEFGSEEEVIASMVAYLNPESGQIGPDAYWQRIDLPSGICFDPVNTTELIADSKSRLALVGLVRNFAMLTVTCEAEGYELASAVLVNAPDRGYVAPYNRTTSQFQFDYQNYTTAELIAAGYPGAIPPTAVLNKGLTNVVAAVDNKVSLFTLEREKPVSSPCCVIVGVKKDSKTSYFKINLVDNEGNQYPILRNFNYNIILANVFKEGYSTVEDAYASAGSGDVSTNVEFEDLTSISNGESFLAVEYTQKIVIKDGAFTLDYKFVPDLTDKYSSGTHSGEAMVENSVASGEVDGITITLGEPGSLGAAIQSYSVAASDNSDLTRTLTIVPTAPSALPKSQVITIVGQHVTEKGGATVKTTIQRKVTIIVRGKYDMTLSCTPQMVEEQVGEDVTLNITLPKNLPASIFPLEMAIEGEALSLSPKDGDISVVTGPSIIPGSTKPSAFHFIKTINYSEYSDGTTYTQTFPVHFKTNTKESASDIYVANEYFNTAKTGFFNPYKFSSLAFSEVSSDNSVSFSFNMPTTDPVTVTLTGLTPAEGSGLVANADGTYTYTPSTAGVQTLALLWTGSTSFSVSIVGEQYPKASQNGSMIKARFADTWYTGTPKQYAATTLSALVLTSDVENTTVNFIVGGKTIPATKGSAVNGETQYTASYTPQTAGDVEVTVKAVCGTQVSTAKATMTVAESIFEISFPTDDWYEKADEETNGNAAAQDVETKVSVLLKTPDVTNTKVSIKVGDQTAVQADLKSGNDTDGYIYTATVTPGTYGTLAVTATATLSSATKTATENMVVWKKVEIPGETTYSLGTALTAATFDTTKEYVLMYDGKYLYNDNGTLKGKTSTDIVNDATARFTFAKSSSQSAIKSVSANKSINSDNSSITLGNATNFYEVYSRGNGISIYTITTSGKGSKKTTTYYHMYINSSNNVVINSGTTEGAYYWTIYPVTSTTAASTYTWTDPTAQTSNESFIGEAGAY